ncbi:MAG: hypothetical protein ACYC3P_08655 [Bellilinea sp.]
MKNPETKLLFVILLGALIVAACRSSIPTPLPLTAIPLPTAKDIPPAALAAQTALAQKLGLSTENVTIQNVEPALWSDSCLGLGAADEICLQVLTSGYLVTLLAEDQIYEYRTDQDGTVVRATVADEEPPAAVAAAQQALADLLTVDPTSITVVSVDAVDWPDACLGVPTPGACAQVITPGYRIILSVSGQSYEFHTNQDGSLVIPAYAVGDQSRQPIITLISTDAQGECEQILVSSTGVGAGPCDSTPKVKSFPGMQRSVELGIWQARYAAFEIIGKDGSLKFDGRGTQTAELEEQRAMIAWTRLTELDVSGLPNDPPAGLLIDWRRTGGIAGLCNRLMIFESGFAYARNCDDAALGQTLLPLEQLKLLYNWRDTLASSLVTASDNVTDGFNYDLIFNGAGSQSPDDITKQAMLVLAAQLYALLVQ